MGTADSWQAKATVAVRGQGQVQEVYRGHAINLSRSTLWSAVLTELASGAVLPTKATALLGEGKTVALSRGRKLVDLYVEADARAEADAA